MSESGSTSWETLPKNVQNVLQTFVISQERLCKISEDIEAEFKNGLALLKSDSIAMLPSYVPALPDGSGMGYFLSGKLKFKKFLMQI